MKTLITFALAAVALTACGNGPEQGAVVDTWHEPMQIRTSCTTKPKFCHPTTTVDPEAWHLKLRNGGEKGWRTVPKSFYDRCPAGTQYPACAGITSWEPQ